MKNRRTCCKLRWGLAMLQRARFRSWSAFANALFSSLVAIIHCTLLHNINDEWCCDAGFACLLVRRGVTLSGFQIKEEDVRNVPMSDPKVSSASIFVDFHTSNCQKLQIQLKCEWKFFYMTAHMKHCCLGDKNSAVRKSLENLCLVGGLCYHIQK